ncbi:hypothetical protein K501DRAFT_212077 [Backusella circina FSU 941]|nr:hypothetical protein K501DRAFT_212077 [Backusella circina FSU 941]
MAHTHSALQIYQFIYALYQQCEGEEPFGSILRSLKTPRFTSVSAITDRWTPIFTVHFPMLSFAFSQIMQSAERSPEYDTLLIKLADHFSLIYNVSCLLDNDLELEAFVRSLSFENQTVEHVKLQVFSFLNTLDPDTKEFVANILMNDKHGYLTAQDTQVQDQGFLDLDRVFSLINDRVLFDQFMAIIQANSTNQTEWQQTLFEIQALLSTQPGIFEKIAPLLQQMKHEDSKEYSSYEDYVQKNFLDNGGKEYLDSEIDRAQVEHMFGNLSMH